MTTQAKQKEREKEETLKRLRSEIAQQIEDRLPQTEGDFQAGSAPEPKRPDVHSDEEAKRVVEAILFASSRPLSVNELRKALGGFSASKIEILTRELKSEYEQEGRSFHISEVAGGFQLTTDAKFAPWIVRLERDRKVKHATQSALETLAILAYKQPVTRTEIEDLRGVDVAGVLNTLLERNLIKIVGRKEVPGRPFLYGTTSRFLEHFGLKSVADLPNISEIQSLVDQTVKREELLRTEKIVEAVEEEIVQEDDVRAVEEKVGVKETKSGESSENEANETREVSS
jgi:segregation and condensation protein B